MKKIILSLVLLIYFQTFSFAQALQYEHKSVLFSETIFSCPDGYTHWARGAFDTISSVQNTNGIPFYFAQYDASNPSTSTSPLSWQGGVYIGTNCTVCYANQPTFTMDNTGLPIFESDYYEYNNNNQMIFKKLIDTLATHAQQQTAAPAIAAIGFDKIMAAPDSVVIKTRTKFVTNGPGIYFVTVFAVEDSAMGMQAVWDTSAYNYPHRFMLRGNIASGVWGWALNMGNPITAGQEFLVDFSQKIPVGWNINKLSYLMVLTRRDVAANKYFIENATEGAVATGINDVSAVNENVVIYPQPAKDKLFIKMQLDKSWQDASIDLYNLLGQKIATLYKGNLKTTEQLDLTLPTQLATGNYIIDIHNSNNHITKSIMVK